jgi:hypothetical protein
VENIGAVYKRAVPNKGKGMEIMFTISDILADIDRGCAVNNMVEDRFSYRIVFFVNEGNKGSKYYIDTAYGNLRKSLEGIIRDNLSLTNSVVIAETTVLKNGKCVYLQSRSYSFSLEGYFRQIIKGDCKDRNRNGNITYNRCAVS